MTGERPWPRVPRWRRFGPAVVVVAALVAAGVTATVESRSSSAGPTTSTPDAAGLRSLATNPELPVTYQEAQRAGTTAKYTWPAGCDRARGRLAVPSVYAPPCVPVTGRANGGATAPGVTATTITVVDYLPPPGDLASALSGAAGDPATNVATAQGYVAMLNRIVSLYGRRVVLVPFHATGTSTDAVAARADAIDVAEQIHAFASIGGPVQTPVYQDQLARLHVLCLSCGLGSPASEYRADAPYLWGSLPAVDTVLSEAFTYVTTQLMHRDAVWAGEAAFRRRPRSFALISYTQNPPVYQGLTQELDRKFAASHLTFALQESYLLDLSQLPTEAATLAEHLKRSGATTVIFAGDPIMPIYLTKACAAIGYFPEWVITGTVFTSTSTLGRLYDQREWAHAFGVSDLPVPTPIQDGDAYRLYRWYYGTDPPARTTASVILPTILQLFDGIEVAGPRLTADTFAGGLFRQDPVGGTPVSPLQAYGYRGAPPLPSFATPADYTFIWYDAAATGADEQGVPGHGLVEYVHGGARYPAADIPRAAVPMFDPRGAVTGYASLPAAERAPSEPPWPGSPASAGAKTP